MRLVRLQALSGYVLVGLFLVSGKVTAQPDDRNISVPAKTKAVDWHVPRSEEAKRSTPAIVLLRDLIEEALTQNPEIIAMRRNFDMMRARVPQAKALPDKMRHFYSEESS